MHAWRCQWIKFNNITICVKGHQKEVRHSSPQNEFTGSSRGCKQKWLVNRWWWWWWWWWWLHFCGVLTLWLPRTFIYILKDMSRYWGGIGTSSLYHSFIFCSCSAFSSMVIWKGMRRNNVNRWPDSFLRSYWKYWKLHHKLMFCCEVLKKAAIIVLTTLPDQLHFTIFTCFKARITTKQNL